MAGDVLDLISWTRPWVSSSIQNKGERRESEKAREERDRVHRVGGRERTEGENHKAGNLAEGKVFKQHTQDPSWVQSSTGVQSKSGLKVSLLGSLALSSICPDIYVLAHFTDDKAKTQGKQLSQPESRASSSKSLP